LFDALNVAGAWMGIIAAVGGGLLIGLERERHKGQGPRRSLAGVRTFTIAALAGALARSTAQPLLVAAGALLVVVLTLIAYRRDRSGDPGATTEVALFLTYVLGVVAFDRPALSAGAAVIVTALLASRRGLHRFARETLTEGELGDGLLFCGAWLVVLPLLPARETPWLAGVSPRRLWSLVILFMGLQAGGYVALRAAGPRLGLALSGFAGGFVSSTATIAAMGLRARAEPSRRTACVAGALSSTVATMVLMAIVVVAVDPASLRACAPSLLAGTAAAIAGVLLSLRGNFGSDAEIARGRAFNLLHALTFAAALSALTAGMAFLRNHVGGWAVAVSTALAGFFDVHAAAASALSLAASGGAPRAGMLTAVLLALSTNTISKIVAALATGGTAYGLRVLAGLLAVLGALWAPLVWR